MLLARRPDTPLEELPGWQLQDVTPMTRSFGKLYASIWGDQDFTRLQRGPQHLYELLLSQSRLTLPGSLDLMPERWAALSAGTTADDIVQDLQALEASRFVVIDWTTRELVIRTLVRHDLDNGRLNSNLIKGFWTAWAGVISPILRKVVVDHIPDSLWDRSSRLTPSEAERMRSSPRLELPVLTNGSNQPSEPLSPVASLLSPVAAASRDPRALSVPASTPPVDNPGDTIDQAIELLTSRELQRNPTRGPSVDRHATAVRRAKHRDHAQQARALLHANPELTPAQLADLLEPPARQQPRAQQATGPDPYAGQRAAHADRAARTSQQLDQLRDVPPAKPDVVARALADGRAAVRHPKRGDTDA